MQQDAAREAEKATDDKTAVRRSKPRRWLKRVLIALAILLALLAIAPSVVSMLWGSGIVESIVNAEIKGRITVRNVSVSWLSDVRLEGLEVFDPEDRKVVEANRITLKKNLFGLIGSWTNLNELEIFEPNLLLYVDEQGDVSLTRTFEAKTPAKAPSPPPPLRGHLTLIGGKGEIISHDNQRRGFSYSAECKLVLCRG
jgi:hypothetical protein